MKKSEPLIPASCVVCKSDGPLETLLMDQQVSVTVCVAAGPCIQRARTAGTWAK